MALAAAMGIVGLAAVPAAEAAPKTISGFIGAGLGERGGEFIGARDVTVYTAGDSDPANDKIFVVEGEGTNNSRVQRLDGHGNFELMWGKDVIANGASGDTGIDFEVCTEAVSDAAGCKAGETGAGDGELSDPHGIAVNQSTGHVYVMDRGNSRVQEFDLDGSFVRTWGQAGSGDGEFQTASSAGVGIAVDPVNGDVFVADPGNGRVQQFTATGGFVASFGVPGSGVGEFGGEQPLKVAVDSNHIVYASDSNDSNRVQRYDADADAFLTPIACCDPAPGAPLVDGVTAGLEIDPDSDGVGTDEEHLLVARNPSSGDTVVQELDIPTPATDPVTTVVDTHVYEADPNSPGVEVDRDITGIGIDPTNGNLYLSTLGIFTVPNGNGTFTGCSDPDSCSGLIVLSADSEPLGAVLASADPEATSAFVEGSVNAGGGVATYRIELLADGDTEWQDAGVAGYASGVTDVPVAGELVGLQPNTLYLVRIVVRKQTGFTTHALQLSNELAVLTDLALPDVETLGSSQRTDTSARLRARIDPNGSDTTYRFEYGLAGGPLDQEIPVPDGSAGAGNSPELFVADLDGLEPETAYEYRIVATNDAGTATGDVVGFVTEAPPVASPPVGRGYELVSPADKIAGVGVGIWYNGPAASAHVGTAAQAGERFAVQGALGAVLVDGPYAYSNDWALAERTPAGWVSAPGTSRRAHGSQAKADITMSAAARDLSLTSWTSGGHTLKFFPEMESWGATGLTRTLFLRDWTEGKWELFGPTDESQVVSGRPSLSEGDQAIADGGSAAVASAPGTRGLAGPGDPTSPAFPDLAEPAAASVYLEDLSDGLTDMFPGDNGVRTLVNVCTDGTKLPAVDEESGELQDAVACPPLESEDDRDARLISSRGGSLGPDTDGVISADGSRVFFMSPDPAAGGTGPCAGTGIDSACPAQLYVWQRDSGGNPVTRWISRSEVAGQDASLMAPVFFEGASKDGDKVFFRTTGPLTADDPNGAGTPPPGGVTTGAPNPESSDLYMYDLPDGPDGDPATPDGDPEGGDLVRISAGPDEDGDCNARAGTLRFLSDDGSRAYFACSAALTGLPTTGSGTIADPGGTPADTDAANLYLHDASRAVSERWRFVARLPRTSPLGACATTAVRQGSMLTAGNSDAVSVAGLASCVNGTSDGSLITFFTDGRLVADDPNAASGDVYGYDLEADELSRLSAPRASGPIDGYPCAPGGSSVLCFGDGGIAPSVAPLTRLGVATRPGGERLAFFESRSQLLDEDTDDAYDVYQWRASADELTLLTTGDSDTDGAFFAGNDAAGLNVYFATRDRLTWQDGDSVLDIYTARVGGGIPEPPPPPGCDPVADGCQPPGPPAGQPRINSKGQSGGDVTPRARVTLSLSTPSRRARARAARTGVLALRLRISRPGLIRVSARARIGGKARRVAAARKRAAKAGTVRVRLRLNRAARRRLASGRALRLEITARTPGAVSRTATATLKRSGR